MVKGYVITERIVLWIRSRLGGDAGHCIVSLANTTLTVRERECHPLLDLEKHIVRTLQHQQDE